MTIARLLARKGHDVATAPPHRTIHQVAETLTQKKIGAVVIAGPSGEVFGILSERDIVRAVSNDGALALNAPASRYMTVRVVCIVEDDSIEDAMAMMSEGRFRHLPVIRNNRLMGIVSIGDIVKSRIERIETEHRAMREYIAMA